MSAQQRPTHDPESKSRTVLRTEEPGRAVREVAESVGIISWHIYGKRRHMRDRGELAFPAMGERFRQKHRRG